MFKKAALAVLVIACLYQVAQARDTDYKLPIQDVLNSPDFADKVGSDVKFFFADQKAVPKQNLGEFVTNKKTNAFNKTDEEACRWVMLSALIELRDRAKTEGGNAVVGISSYYKKEEFKSATQYECHAGGLIAGVALKGTVVKIH